MTASRARMYLLEIIEWIEANARETKALSQELGTKLEALRVQGNLVIRLQRELAQMKAEVNGGT